MLSVTPVGWTATLAVIAGLLALDLCLSGRRRGGIRLGEAVGWSAFYVGAALLFGVIFGAIAGWDLGAQYFAGYVVEKSLSIDNLFVFVVILAAFAVPVEQQAKALTVGIILALVLRGILIARRCRAPGRVLGDVPAVRARAARDRDRRLTPDVPASLLRPRQPHAPRCRKQLRRQSHSSTRRDVDPC